METDREQNVQNFLKLIKKSRRGKFKLYIGMIAGVGKSYRMLQEAHELLETGIDVQIGFIETHGRPGTEVLLDGIPIIPRRNVYYKGKELEEMDLDAIIRIHPEIVIVDELAHTNIEGSKNEKRWEDVLALLDEGINVISAVNIQHIDSLNDEVRSISGIEIQERVPDSILQQADEIVNIDLTADELISRLKAGKIYSPDKVNWALNNFFKIENILQLRELALKEVALRIERQVENEVLSTNIGVRHERFLACISSNDKTPRHIIRKAARLAARYNSTFVALYVQTPRESGDKISLARQRYLINNFKLITELNGEVVRVQSNSILNSILEVCHERQISTICIGTPRFEFPRSLFSLLSYRRFLQNVAQANIDLIIVA
jgi:two-component system sensor histidine kinase KdpD